jgi:glutamate-1-semialdehyde aminotransferase
MKTYNCVSVSGTFSRSPKAYGFSPSTCVLEGNGSKIKLNNNKWVLDFVCGLGPMILGYNNTAFDHRVMMQLRKGSAFSIQSSLEQEAGSKLVHLLGHHVPGWDADDLGVRWGLSGTDACNMAIRLARAITGKFNIIKIGYHGASVEFVCDTPPALGIIPDEKNYVKSFNFNDIDGIKEWLDNLTSKDDPVHGYYYRDDLAAIIIEQPSEEPSPDYYPFLRQVCDETGALLVVDEVVSGFRYALGGICEKYNIKPDLCCYGKALGNGVPVSALVGPKEYMDWWSHDSPPFCSSTFYGNAISCAAAGAFLDIWNQKSVDYIWDIGTYFMKEMAKTGWEIFGHPVRSVMKFDSDAERAWFIHGMLDHGVLMNRPNFVSLAHTRADVDMTRDAAIEVYNDMPKDKMQLEKLMADKMPRVLFRNR